MKKYSANKQAQRRLSLLPNGKPRYIRCYDSGDNSFLDRYTVVYTGRYTDKTNGNFWYVGMSQNPFIGIGSHGESKYKPIDRPTYKHLGKKIKFDDLTEDCKKLVMSDYLYLWDFTDENGKEI